MILLLFGIYSLDGMDAFGGDADNLYLVREREREDIL